MADNTNQKADDTIRTLEDASGVKWPAGVFAHATAVGTPDTLAVPIAAALVDGASNPTALILGSAPLVFNGTTWDRLRGDATNGLKADVTRMPATAANGAAMPGVQVAIGGFDGTAFRQAEFTTSGEQLTHVVNASAITEYQGGALADDDPKGRANVGPAVDTPANRTTAGNVVAGVYTLKGEQYVKHVDPIAVNDGGGSLTVDASALPLPTGAATETTLADVRTAVQVLDNIVSLDKARVSVVDALPSGANKIGSISLVDSSGLSSVSVSSGHLHARELGGALANAQTAVDSTAGGTQILAASIAWRRISLTNLGPNTVYIGTGALTTSNGYPLGVGESIPLATTSLLKDICAASETATVAHLVEA